MLSTIPHEELLKLTAEEKAENLRQEVYKNFEEFLDEKLMEECQRAPWLCVVVLSHPSSRRTTMRDVQLERRRAQVEMGGCHFPETCAATIHDG